MSAAALVPRPVNHPAALVVQLGDGGFLQRVEKKTRLLFGVDLYAAVKGTPKIGDKVQPFQPGYMKLVAAMGGDLLCPPVMRDPVSGQPVANPQVTCYPGTDLIKSVRATAVCVVPNPQTGKLHASVQTITIDAEHVLRQALLNIEREEIVVLLGDDDIVAERAAGKFKGWAVYPLTPPQVNICANLKMPVVREALQTLQNLGGTIRQRACSKAERLAADHNPVTRWTTTYGDLLQDLDVDGRHVNGVAIADTETVTAGAKRWIVVSPAYAEFNTVAWVRHESRAEVDAMLARLATDHSAAGLAEVVIGDTIDVSHELVGGEQLQLEEDDDLDDLRGVTRPRDLALAEPVSVPPQAKAAQEPTATRHGPSARQQSAAPAHAHVATEAAGKATSKPAAVPVAEPAATGVSTAHATLLKRVLSLEVEVTEAIGLAAVMDTLTQMGLRAEEVNTSDLTEAQLRDYQARLTDLLR